MLNTFTAAKRLPPQLVDGVGLWGERHTMLSFTGRPALFLDRDGVVVDECGYLGRAQDVAMMPRIGAAIARVNAAGLPVILVTNQAGIARGYYDWDGFAAVQHVIVERLAREGAHLDLVLACAYHGRGRPPLAISDHSWRKPRPGMVDYGATLLEVDRVHSHIVGDRLSDLEAGHSAGLGSGTLVLTGHGSGDAEMTRRWLADHDAATGFVGEVSAEGPAAIESWLRRVAG